MQVKKTEEMQLSAAKASSETNTSSLASPEVLPPQAILQNFPGFLSLPVDMPQMLKVVSPFQNPPNPLVPKTPLLPGSRGEHLARSAL